MTRIVTSVPRPKRPPKKRKAVALAVPAIVTAKRSRHPIRAKQAAAQVMSRLNPTEAAQPSTSRGAARAPTPANDDPKPTIVTSLPGTPQAAATSSDRPTKSAIVTSISRKRARQRDAGYTAAEPDDDPKGEALVKAFMARMIRPSDRGGWPMGHLCWTLAAERGVCSDKNLGEMPL